MTVITWYLAAWASVDPSTTRGQVLAATLLAAPAAIAFCVYVIGSMLVDPFTGGAITQRAIQRTEQGRRDWSGVFAFVLVAVLGGAVVWLFAGGGSR